MRRPRRNCRKRCLGCDNCWICRRSYPNTLTISQEVGYGSECCAAGLGTYVTAPWGQSTADHYSFGTDDIIPNFELGKPKCMAAWEAVCGPPLSSEAGDVLQLLRIYMWVGTLLPSLGPGVVDDGGSTIANNPASSRVDVLIQRINRNDSFVYFDRRERHQVDLPKPCPTSGVFELEPILTPTIFNAGFLFPANCSSTSHIYQITIEITDP